MRSSWPASAAKRRALASAASRPSAVPCRRSSIALRSPASASTSTGPSPTATRRDRSAVSATSPAVPRRRCSGASASCASARVMNAVASRAPISAARTTSRRRRSRSSSGASFAATCSRAPSGRSRTTVRQALPSTWTVVGFVVRGRDREAGGHVGAAGADVAVGEDEPREALVTGAQRPAAVGVLVVPAPGPTPAGGRPPPPPPMPPPGGGPRRPAGPAARSTSCRRSRSSAPRSARELITTTAMLATSSARADGRDGGERHAAGE